MDKQIFQKYSPLFALIACFLLGFLFTFTDYWQLSIVAGLIGGLLCNEMKWGAVTGLLGILLSWSITIWYQIITNYTLVLLNQIADLILGSDNLGSVFILIIYVIGALLGTLGGSIGSGIRMSIESWKSVTKE